MILARLRSRGYTLVEVLAATTIIGLGMAAATSLSTTVMIQEEVSWRVSVALNYQENATRLFQLGFNPTAGSHPAEVSISQLMPRNPVIDEMLDMVGADSLVATSSVANVNVPVAGAMQQATTAATISRFSSATNGSTTNQVILRPTAR
jgi:prepilin-type N-terminal cleavage/methylation domain-containing protein